MTKATTPKVSVFDAPPLAGATYVATIEEGDFGNPGPNVAIEKGSFQCRRLVELLDRAPLSDDEARYAQEAEKTCDRAIGKLLRQPDGFLFIVDGQGPRWLSAQQVLATAAPIDTPAKALLAVWVTGTYELGWEDGKRFYGSHEAGIVRAVAGGFEVVASTSSTQSHCGDAREKETVTNYRHVIFVDATGAIREREKVVSHRHDISDPCHPLGRRPEDFADIEARGWLRAMHHEAESVRAFERIARELRAHGAPDELCEAAAQAACDERDHAERCARLAGARATIASDELGVRSLVELAIDNASEGCVGESYAALVAATQARTAADAVVRAHYAEIATDELAHAALAHAIAGWVDGQLTPAERARVRAAREAALVELAAAADVAVPLLRVVAAVA
jgi:hypothetical protein